MRGFTCILIAMLYAATSFSQSNTAFKKITITVIDAATRALVPEAQVTIKGAVFGGKTRTVDSYGKAYFEITPNPFKDYVTIEATDASWPKSHSDATQKLPLTSQESYAITIYMQSSNRGVVITVQDEQGQALVPATVTLKSADEGRNMVQNTSGPGTATFSVFLWDSYKDISYNVTMVGYKPYSGTITISKVTSQATATVTLQKDYSSKILKITVKDDKGNAVPEASLYASVGYLGTDLHSATSDQNGYAAMVFNSSGEFDLKITHSKFETLETKFKVNHLSSEELQPMEFTLTRKQASKRTLNVLVVNKEGTPIPNALVEANGVAWSTGADGKATLKSVANLGDQVTVSAVAAGYQKGYKGYLAGTDNYRYMPPIEDDLGIVLNKAIEQATLKVQVLDAENYRPLAGADVSLQVLSGEGSYPSKSTDVKGIAKFTLSGAAINSSTIRVKAKAKETKYTQGWSDITPDFFSAVANETEKYFTIYLKNTAADKIPDEKKYGPYTVTPGKWTSTGLSFKKGQQMRVEASGTWKYKEGLKTEFGPGGGGYWGWFVLKAKFNEQMFDVGTKGGGSAPEDAELELGAPATVRMGHGDEAGLEGAYIVYVFARGVTEKKSNLKDPAVAARLEKAEQHERFLERLIKKGNISTLSAKEVTDQIKSIVYEFDLKTIKEDRLNPMQECLDLIGKEYFYLHSKGEQPSQQERDQAYHCLDKILDALQEVIGKMVTE